MKQIIITKNGEVSNGPCLFSSMEELNQWKTRHVAMGTFIFEDKIIPPKFNVDGDIIEESYVIPHTHEFEISDVADPQVAIDAMNYLQSTRWYVDRLVETGEPIPVDIATARTEARSKL